MAQDPSSSHLGAGRQQLTVKHLLAIPLLSLMWGLNWVSMGIALRELQPWSLRAGTLGSAGLIMLALGALSGQPLRVPRSQWGRLIGFTILYGGVLNILASFSQLVSSTGRTAIVTFTMPIWATILAAYFLGERIDRTRAISLCFGAGGLIALGWPLVVSRGAGGGWLLALAGAWSWAIAVVILKRFPISAPPFAIAAWQLIISAIFMLCGMVLFEHQPFPATVSWAVIIALTYHVASQTISQVLYFFIVEQFPAAVAALGIILVPAVATGASILILGEKANFADCLGLLMISCASATIQIPMALRVQRRALGARV